jgi:hypothetical protein
MPDCRNGLPAHAFWRPWQSGNLDTGFTKIRHVIGVWARMVHEDKKFEKVTIEVLEE